MCRGEAVIAVSETVRTYILSNYPKTPVDRLCRIYRGVDPSEFPYGYKPADEWLEQFYSEFPQARGKTILCLPGRLTRLKGQHDFIDLVSKLCSDRDDIHGLIVGGEDPKRQEYAQELYSRVRDMGLGGSISFTGARSDIRDIFAISALVFSLSTKPESFGRTVLEALSLGRPVLGYGHGGVGEILDELFPDGKVEIADGTELHNVTERMLEQNMVLPPVNKFSREQMLSGTLETYIKLAKAN